MDTTKKRTQGAARAARHRSKSVTVTLSKEAGEKLLELADSHGIEVNAKHDGTRRAAVIELLIEQGLPTPLPELVRTMEQEQRGDRQRARNAYLALLQKELKAKDWAFQQEQKEQANSRKNQLPVGLP
ncbi:hypothetical protein KI809_18370 [Geobacter pelophilus]|uniref:Ribbon-helix-helix protein, copG family n=1 Tax=Geoanaerobacter pelophilus TaxID=60036 RepID=A0AAW4LCJ1_9BACT|nr:hypothetical protein [Geoanaerobacter pelophilus]MBT0666280.1 hypothetical protein [Geoanaerobacter pelophilus]